MYRKWLSAIVLMAAGAAASWTVASLQTTGQQPAADTEVAQNEAHQSPLHTLDWMVGDWVASGEGTTAEFSCHYTKNDAFLMRSFRILTSDSKVLSGTQLIGWDASEQSIRSWTFESSGGFGEEVWSQAGDRYTLRARYTMADGSKASSMHILNYVDENTCTWRSVNRELGGEFRPDTDEITLVRQSGDAAAKEGN